MQAYVVLLLGWVNAVRRVGPHGFLAAPAQATEATHTCP
jgi:hypothetical protein